MNTDNDILNQLLEKAETERGGATVLVERIFNDDDAFDHYSNKIAKYFG